MIGSDTFSLTQELLSHMLGVQRNTVAREAHAVQQAGLIRYSRGHITILNRDGLEDCACECYSVIRAETDKMMGPAKSQSEPEIRQLVIGRRGNGSWRGGGAHIRAPPQKAQRTRPPSPTTKHRISH